MQLTYALLFDNWSTSQKTLCKSFKLSHMFVQVRGRSPKFAMCKNCRARAKVTQVLKEPISYPERLSRKGVLVSDFDFLFQTIQMSGSNSNSRVARNSKHAQFKQKSSVFGLLEWYVFGPTCCARETKIVVTRGHFFVHTCLCDFNILGLLY